MKRILWAALASLLVSGASPVWAVTDTFTETGTATDTATPTDTGTVTASATVTATVTASATRTSTATRTATSTMTPKCGFALVAPGKYWGMILPNAFDTVANSTARTAFNQLGCEPRESFLLGRQLRFFCAGLLSNLNQGETLTFTIYLDQPFVKTLITFPALTFTAANTNAHWAIDGSITVTSYGNSGAVITQAHAYVTGTTNVFDVVAPSTATVINTHNEHKVGASAQWSVASAGNTITQQFGYIYLGN